ncbi:5-formyltetrahydrofolate cyclo-ligase, partial [Bacillus cereus]|uniref:5-formyltetrahydrofolate cyclo-ligase n=1 Tax=Bacillus cereus TaxID=1396 RepID=UPI0028490A90
ILVPKTLPERQMCFFKIDPDTRFERTAFGVLEPLSDHSFSPDAIDLLIVPGVVYHQNGYRIGFGGGYYDRYLANYPNQTCSLVFQEQINNQLVPESFDKKVQHLFIDK